MTLPAAFGAESLLLSSKNIQFGGVGGGSLEIPSGGKHNENFGDTSQLSSRLIYRNWIAANEQFPVGRISLKRIFLYIYARAFQARPKTISDAATPRLDGGRRRGEIKM